MRSDGGDILYIVRRPFRNFGRILTPGTPVKPEDIKRFKSRLNERDIIEVTAGTLDMWDDYFVGKFGVSIKSQPEPEPEPKHKVAQSAQPAKVVVKAK